MPISHATAATGVDSGDGKISKNAWNQAHTNPDIADVNGLQAALDSKANGGAGTSFPGTPATGQRHFRTDRGIEYFYDGTRWLSVTLFTQELTYLYGSIPYSASNGDALISANPFSGKYDIFVEEFYAALFFSAAGTWSVALTAITAGSANAMLGSSISQSTSSSWQVQRTAISAVVSSVVDLFAAAATLVSGTPSLYPRAGLNYRIIG